MSEKLQQRITLKARRTETREKKKLSLARRIRRIYEKGEERREG